MKEIKEVDTEEKWGGKESRRPKRGWSQEASSQER